MSPSEFSNEFEILYNLISSNQAPSVNEYEKSVFLTQAQEEIAQAAYTGRLNGQPFEAAEEIRAYVQDLLETSILDDKLQDPGEVYDKTTIFELPENAWFIVYEQVVFDDEKAGCKSGARAKVKPVTHDQFDRIKDNPFKGPNKNRVLRLSLSENRVELVSKYNIDHYLVRYLRRPNPIITEDLSYMGVSINGASEVSGSELNSAIHRVILKRAVDIAREVWG